jgi:hypothetical protein
MQLFKRRDALDALEDLLDKERRILLQGNYDSLARLMAEKERLLKNVTASRSLATLAGLKGKVDRNQAMLLAASKGIRAVTDSLAKREDKTDSLQTYDRTGRRKAAAQRLQNLERRV